MKMFSSVKDGRSCEVEGRCEAGREEATEYEVMTPATTSRECPGRLGWPSPKHGGFCRSP